QRLRVGRRLFDVSQHAQERLLGRVLRSRLVPEDAETTRVNGWPEATVEPGEGDVAFGHRTLVTSTRGASRLRKKIVRRCRPAIGTQPPMPSRAIAARVRPSRAWQSHHSASWHRERPTLGELPREIAGEILASNALDERASVTCTRW